MFINTGSYLADMRLAPPEKQRGLKRERLLRALLSQPGGSLSKRELARRAGTTPEWAVNVTNQLEDKGYVNGTAVTDHEQLFEYWLTNRVDPNRVTVSLQEPVHTIQATNFTHAFTTYHAENAKQGYLFPASAAVYIHPEDTDDWTNWIESNALIGGGNTEFRILDEHVFYDAAPVNDLHIVSTPQLILDLLDEGGPCVEAAHRLMEVTYG